MNYPFGLGQPANAVVSTITEFESYCREFDYVSFDLFDTLIYRSSITAAEILEISSSFACGLIKVNCGLVVDPSVFLKLRRKLTSDIKKAKEAKNSEPELGLVFNSVLDSLGIEHRQSGYLARQILEFELALEIKSLKAMPGVISLLERIKNDGKLVVIVSDMYFSEDVIRMVLSNCQIEMYVDHLFVSSAYGSTKRSGELYSHVLSLLRLEPSKLIHIGDNFKSDVFSAKNMGLHAVHLSGGGQLPNDTFLLDGVRGSDELVARLVLAFCYQVALYANLNGIRRLYFLSRDATAVGEVFEFARETDQILQSLLVDTKLRYLSVSRASTIFLNLKYDDYTLADILKLYLVLETKGYRLSDFFEFIGLDKFASDLGGLYVCSKSDVAKVADQILFRFPEIEQRVVRLVGQKRNDILEYLNQESVLGAPGPIGFIDIGYSGSIARNIASFVSSKPFNGENSLELHVMLICGGNHFSPNSYSHGGLVKFMQPLILERHLTQLQKLNFSWFECFFQPSHIGVLSSYKKIDGAWRGVFNDGGKQNVMLKHWVQKSHDIIEKEDCAGMFLKQSNARGSVVEFIDSMARPSEKTLEIISNYGYLKGLMDHEREPIIDENISFISMLRPSYLKQKIESDVWIEGSLLRQRKYCSKVVLSLLVAIYLAVSRFRSR